MQAVVGDRGKDKSRKCIILMHFGKGAVRVQWLKCETEPKAACLPWNSVIQVGGSVRFEANLIFIK